MKKGSRGKYERSPEQIKKISDKMKKIHEERREAERKRIEEGNLVKVRFVNRDDRDEDKRINWEGKWYNLKHNEVCLIPRDCAIDLSKKMIPCGTREVKTSEGMVMVTEYEPRFEIIIVDK